MLEILECDRIKTLGKEIAVNNEIEIKVYNVEEIQEMLSLGRNSTYAFLDKVYKEQKPFRVLKFGKVIRVPKASFDNWLAGKDDKT